VSKPLRVHAEFSTFSLRTLPPALALADLYSREDSSRPDENDLDIEPQQVAGVALAFERLGVERPPPSSRLLVADPPRILHSSDAMPEIEFCRFGPDTMGILRRTLDVLAALGLAKFIATVPAAERL